MSDPADTPIRAAATVILWDRDATGAARVLMGQRGAGAVFMPAKFVFPGGAVDPQDLTAAPAAGLSQSCRARLLARPLDTTPSPDALLAAGLRETEEETGLAAGPGADLMFVFRAITPPGRPRRFDARFFLGPVTGFDGDLAGFGAASGELRHLRFAPIEAALALDLPFVTEVVLAEVAAILAGAEQPGVPFFDNSGPEPVFRRL
jgi:8-oxo-dGTP pyrophosphatase MutT (NUDIX family)